MKLYLSNVGFHMFWTHRESRVVSPEVHESQTVNPEAFQTGIKDWPALVNALHCHLIDERSR